MSFSRRSRRWIVLILLVFGCSSLASADDAAYKDFSERPGRVCIMDDSMNNLLADPSTEPFFENANQKLLATLAPMHRDVIAR
jgi:hemoglobin